MAPRAVPKASPNKTCGQDLPKPFKNRGPRTPKPSKFMPQGTKNDEEKFKNACKFCYLVEPSEAKRSEAVLSKGLRKLKKMQRKFQ